MFVVNPAPNHLFTDGSIFMSVRSPIPNAKRVTIREPQAARSLNLQKKNFNRIRSPCDFQPATRQDVIVLYLLTRQPLACFWQFLGGAVNRKRIFSCALSRYQKFGLKIPRKQWISAIFDQDRFKKRLKKRFAVVG